MVATAGFKEELSIHFENLVLTITGKPTEQNIDSTVELLHKGIVGCSFKLSLRLDEHIEVQHAHYENGLLSIEVQRIIPEKITPSNSNWRSEKSSNH